MKPNRHFVTSCSPQGYTQYGRRFLSDFLEYFPKQEIMHVFYEHDLPDIRHPRLRFHDLLHSEDLTAFLKRHKDVPARNGVQPDGTINYRFQGTKFARKVFALTSNILPVNEYRIWLDMDMIAKGHIPDEFFNQFCDSDFVAQYLGRSKSWDHSECGFVAYNATGEPGMRFLREFRGFYESDRVFALDEYHDSYVFDYLRRKYEADGHKFRNIASDDIFEVWEASPLALYMTHLKGPIAKSAASIKQKSQSPINIIDLLKQCPNRYAQIPLLLSVYKPMTLVDVGTCDGVRTLEMARECLKHKPAVSVICFDLWDGITPEISAAELNAKRTPKQSQVEAIFKGFQAEQPGFTYKLVPGNTRDTLPNYVWNGPIDFAFIDGGHSVETIRSDYNVLKGHARLILMDDYYTAGVDTAKWGCNSVIAGEHHVLLPLQDNYSNGQSIQMAMLGEAMVKDGKKPLELKTKNSAPDEEIQAHIRYAATLRASAVEATLAAADKLRTIRPVKFVDRICEPHEHRLVLIGSSEELMDKADTEYQQTWDDLRELARDPNNRLCICKTSYRRCFEEGIIPWGCILLDPRDHVAAFIDPHPDVIYFVSSMCHPSTWDLLTMAGAHTIGYHALVGAGEVDTIKKEYGGKGLCVNGGTTSISRGIALFYHLGFRTIDVFGMTSSYKKRLEKPHGRSEKPFIDVTVEGRTFLTDPELVAQSKDAEMIIKLYPDLNIRFRGDGLVNWAVAITNKYEQDNPGSNPITDPRVGAWVNAFRTGDLEIESLSISNAIVALENRKVFLEAARSGLQTLDELLK